MTDMTPNPDEFDFSEMEAQLEDIQLPEVMSVGVLDDMALLTRFRDLTEELKDRKEAMNPKTQTGRDLHSERNACYVELKKRKLM